MENDASKPKQMMTLVYRYLSKLEGAFQVILQEFFHSPNKVRLLGIIHTYLLYTMFSKKPLYKKHSTRKPKM